MNLFKSLSLLVVGSILFTQQNPFRINQKNNHLKLIGSWVFESMTTITKAQREEIKIVYKDSKNIETLSFDESGSISYNVLNDGIEKKGDGIWFAELEYLTIIVGTDTTYGTYKIEKNNLTILIDTEETQSNYGYSTVIKYLAK